MPVPISNVTRRVVYAPSGAGGAGPYAFTFEILANTDIAVYKDDTLLTLTTHYTVTINANGTGSVTITAAGLALAPVSPTQYAIVGNRTIARSTDFTTGGDFFANTLNDELDQQTIFAQQNAEGVARALQAPQTDPTTINMTLPKAADRANKTLAFDANGDPSLGISAADVANAVTYATNAANSATAAASSASSAASSASSASGSASTATTQASNASTSATNAASSASSASTSASAASTSATNAAASASTATTQASNASTSATNAASSASSAATSATNAANSASTATTQATNAASSASSASSSATAAAASAAAAASSYDSFDDRYLGTKASDPTLDNDGNALVTGALYYNTTTQTMKVYDGANWIAATAAGTTSMTRYRYVATSGQTTFSGADANSATMSYTSNNIVVNRNGSTLDPSEYTATNGTSVVLSVAAGTGDIIDIIAFKSFTVADTVPASTGGTFNGDVKVIGNVGIGTSSPAFKLEVVGGTNNGIHIKDAASATVYGGLFTQTSALALVARSNHALTFGTNDTERMRIDSSGNVGIGVTPFANSLSKSLDLVGGAGLFGYANNAYLSANVYYDGGWKYKATGFGTQIEITGTDGVTKFNRFASGSAGASATVLESMRIDSSGRLVVGANSSSGASASDTFIEVRKTGDSFIATQGGAYGTDKQGFVYRRNGTYGAMSFATGGVSIATYSFNQNDDWYWYKWDGSTATSAVRMTIGGAMILRSTLTQNGSPDYAEYFEWSDGNPNAEDRKGKTVVMDGVTGKIRLATSTDSASSIIGVCSRTYGVILDSQELDWADKYLKNEFGEFIKEEVDYVEYVESNGNIRSRLLADGDIPEDATSIRYFTSLNNVVNPNFDSNTEYTPRSKRKEWEPIGLIGKLRIIKGQPVGDRWVKMRDISETVEEWLVR